MVCSEHDGDRSTHCTSNTVIASATHTPIVAKVLCENCLLARRQCFESKARDKSIYSYHLAQRLQRPASVPPSTLARAGSRPRTMCSNPRRKKLKRGRRIDRTPVHKPDATAIPSLALNASFRQGIRLTPDMRAACSEDPQRTY